MIPLYVQPECRCPELEGFEPEQPAHLAECPRYTDCGGWASDPPCGGCDRCIWGQATYYEMLEQHRPTPPARGT